MGYFYQLVCPFWSLEAMAPIYFHHKEEQLGHPAKRITLCSTEESHKDLKQHEGESMMSELIFLGKLFL